MDVLQHACHVACCLVSVASPGESVCCLVQVTAKSTMSTTAKITRTTSQNLVKQGRKLDLENYCAPGVRDLWMPTFILMLNLATILLGIYRLDKVGFCQVDYSTCLPRSIHKQRMRDEAACNRGCFCSSTARQTYGEVSLVPPRVVLELAVMDQTVTLPCLKDRLLRGSGRLVTYTSLRKPAYTADLIH